MWIENRLTFLFKNDFSKFSPKIFFEPSPYCEKMFWSKPTSNLQDFFIENLQDFSQTDSNYYDVILNSFDIVFFDGKYIVCVGLSRALAW